jgi:Tfp pilus assembly protein PilF
VKALTGPQAARLENAFRLLRAGGAAEAMAIARELAKETPAAPDAQHALAVCLSAVGDHEGALQSFARALDLAPGQPMILGNYAKCLEKAGRPAEAIDALERAARALPASAAAWSDFGQAALRQGQRDRATAALERAVSLDPHAARAWHGLGRARRSGGDLEGAETALRRAVALAPQDGAAWVNLGVVLRLLGRPAEALPCLDEARRAGFSGAELLDAEAGTLVDVGRFDTAMERARALNRDYPRYVPGQMMLVHLLWEHGATLAPGEDPFGAIRAAASGQPDNQSLQLAFIGLLLETRQAEEALQCVRQLRALGDHPMMIALEANALELLGRPDQAGALFAQARRALGDSDPSFLNAYTRHLLKAGDWEAAAMQAAEAARADPHNQEALAYLGTAWRLIGDPREHWLCDYERLVDLVEVEPPPGFEGLAAFLDGLEAALEPLHKARREPIHQSLRGGSQTPGKLFGRADPVIAATRASLVRAIERRIASLPSDPGHPFLQRKARSIRFSGSWSVKLWSSGSHVNHIHSEGWMSSAFYVSLPPSVRDKHDADDTAGYIQFGQPPVELGLDLAPRRVIRPRVGCLALFPSYLWHGTVPFEDDAPRITVAFDMTPVG